MASQVLDRGVVDTGSLKDTELSDSVNPSVPGPIALVGSGEYLEQMQEIETQLLTGRAPKYVQLATAAVPDGPVTLARWESMGLQQAERIGVQGVTIPVHTHDDANSNDLVDMISGAGLIYLSGGHPDYLANTLRGTKVWAAILREWSAGAALAGCSAGAMVMTSWIPSIRHPRNGGTEGLGLLPHLRVIPHFDAFSARVPDIVTRFVNSQND